MYIFPNKSTANIAEMQFFHFFVAESSSFVYLIYRYRKIKIKPKWLNFGQKDETGLAENINCWLPILFTSLLQLLRQCFWLLTICFKLFGFWVFVFVLFYVFHLLNEKNTTTKNMQIYLYGSYDNCLY